MPGIEEKTCPLTYNIPSVCPKPPARISRVIFSCVYIISSVATSEHPSYSFVQDETLIKYYSFVGHKAIDTTSDVVVV